MSTPNEKVLVVDPALRGIRLTEFLERQLPKFHRVQLRQLVRVGDVRVNGEVAISSRRLRSDDVVQVAGLAALAAENERPVPANGAQSQTQDSDPNPTAAAVLPPILFESDSVLVVAKPAGVPTVPDRSGSNFGIYGQLSELRPGADLRIVHRLDRDTSGCLLLAKGLEAARHFDAAWRGGLVQKRYCALVHGVVREGEFEVSSWLGPDRRRPGKVLASPEQKKGFRAALTVVVRRREFGRHSLVDLSPRTGRGHQLRVHLSSIGHPIVGDRDYGGQVLLLSDLKRGYKPRLGFEERPILDRMFLHAEALGFSDVDGREIAVEMPIPEDLALAVGKLERFAVRSR